MAERPGPVPEPRIDSGVLWAVLARPDLWWTALQALVRMAAPGWWRRAPYLPWPDGRLWGFRMVTAYGDAAAPPAPEDVITFLEWCKATAPHSPGQR